jgi:hypothetical protein
MADWGSKGGAADERACFRHPDRVRNLVAAGADVTASARDERFDATALDGAGWTKQEAVADYLKSVISKAVDHNTDGEESRP